MDGMKTHFAERIILIGPTGGGKTTVGAAVALLLGWSFIDTDARVEQATGRGIAEFFAHEGEARFREQETTALAEALERTRVVIATGGGIGERSENVELMHARGWVVCLMATPETALRRLAIKEDAGAVAARRPMLAGGDPLDRLYTLQARRQGWYAAADDTIRSDELTVDEVAT